MTSSIKGCTLTLSCRMTSISAWKIGTEFVHPIGRTISSVVLVVSERLSVLKIPLLGACGHS